MKCPICLEPDLAISDRQGVEIDYCPRCRGVWLDRGELDKIIERADRSEGRRDDDDDDRRREYRSDDRPPHHHKKKSFWHELFD
jgi:Zn-finger nucleic acid-binding protein